MIVYNPKYMSVYIQVQSLKLVLFCFQYFITRTHFCFRKDSPLAHVTLLTGHWLSSIH